MAHVHGKRTGKWMFPKAALNYRRAGRSQWINTPFLHLAPSPRAPQDTVPVACNENLLDNMPIIRFIPFPVSLPYILGSPPKSIICTKIPISVSASGEAQMKTKPTSIVHVGQHPVVQSMWRKVESGFGEGRGATCRVAGLPYSTFTVCISLPAAATMVQCFLILFLYHSTPQSVTLFPRFPAVLDIWLSRSVYWVLAQHFIYYIV